MLLTACGNNNADNNVSDSSNGGREVINQVSLLQGLTFGDYNGSVPVSRLKELGDIGIGTFDALNGELIMLDGTVYRAAHDGTIEKVSDEETIPFSNVTFFDADETVKLANIDSVNTLKSELDKKVKELGENYFYMIRAEGTYSIMKVRSELNQTKPYKPLAEVLETDQTFFDYENIKGTVVGLYCPEYMEDLNAVGWHFHFISDDRKAGGHVLDLSADEIDVSMDRTDNFSMVLPDNDMFNNFDLTVDQSEDIKKVETGDGKDEKTSEKTDETGDEDTPASEAREGFSIQEISDDLFDRMKKGNTYKEDCIVPREDLRYLLVLHKDKYGNTHQGEMVVHKLIADDVLEIFEKLYDSGYPIERMVLPDNYMADDEIMMRDNNSSSFNFRFISHTDKISKHGLGMAVDINTLYNPYHKIVTNEDGTEEEVIEPATGKAYLDRTQQFDYKVEKDDLCYRLFTEKGFEWGGDWTDRKDYQHFELPTEITEKYSEEYSQSSGN
jgi:alpha-acetolactate decarboxylase